MWDNQDRDMLETLSIMARQSRDRCNGNAVEGRKKMADWIQNDRRLDAYDPQRLADRVALCRSNGARLDLSDPALLRGGKPRPLSR
jgi:hypothetical protein